MNTEISRITTRISIVVFTLMSTFAQSIKLKFYLTCSASTVVNSKMLKKDSIMMSVLPTQ